MEEKDQKLMQEVTNYVESTGKWYRFFGVMAVIGAALVFLAGVSVLISSSFVDYAYNDLYSYGSMPANTEFNSTVLIITGILYILMSGLMVPVAVFMFRGANAARDAVNNRDNEKAVLFLKNTKSYWKFYGILTIVVISICLLVFFIGILSAASMAH
jgi:hypothetical protein